MDFKNNIHGGHDDSNGMQIFDHVKEVNVLMSSIRVRNPVMTELHLEDGANASTSLGRAEDVDCVRGSP